MTNSAGLHRYRDPEDGEIYLYTHCEPFFCHRWFPCFDQPSLNARLLLNVYTPNRKWKVFSNASVLKQVADHDELVEYMNGHYFSKHCTERGTAGRTLFIFDESPETCSYLYGMDAGNFSAIENDNKEFPIPIRIGIRRSKIKYLDAREYFRILEAAIEFYEEFF